MNEDWKRCPGCGSEWKDWETRVSEPDGYWCKPCWRASLPRSKRRAAA